MKASIAIDVFPTISYFLFSHELFHNWCQILKCNSVVWFKMYLITKQYPDQIQVYKHFHAIIICNIT